MHGTLLTLLDRWAIERNNHPAYIFLNSQGQEEEVVSFKQLREKALQIACALAARKLEKERIILAISPGLSFIVSFLGCLYAKSIAVPLPPPRSRRQLARSIPVINDAMPALILADQKLGNDFLVPSMTVEDLLNTSYKNDHDLPQISGNDIAFLQYTSGSTSLPKGVVLTHANLSYHQQVIQKAFRHNEGTKIVGWLPFYHDMGLIGNILHALHLGVTSILMAPMTFIQRPILWLEVISRYRATTSGGPNFAYQHCVARITEGDLEKLDLTSWKLAFNGSERVQTDTLKSFSDRFSQVGFCSTAFYPCYGLAEATLFVTGRQDTISIPFQTTEGQVSDVVSCGHTALEDKVMIVNPTSKEPCLEGMQGEIWVQGSSVAAGYWNKDEESKQAFEAYTATGLGPFLRTGDIGFIKNEELFILGRLKNLIILRGKNYFPHDLENCVRQAHPLLAYTQGVVFSQSTADGETLIIVQEIERNLKDSKVAEEIFKAIKKSLIEEFDISPEAIILVKPNSLPRTTSGKLQHHLARELFQQNLFSPLFSWQGQKNNPVEEETISSALAKLLGISVEHIVPDEPMIGLGVDSLIGMQFLSWIQKRFEVEIDLSLILNGATIQQIEEIIQKSPNAHSQIQSPTPSQPEYPLSWNQENVWTYQQLNPQSLAYNIFFAIRIKGALNTSIFKKAISQLVARHAALRTRFELHSSEPVQIISDVVDILLVIYDLKTLAKQQQDIEIQEQLQKESHYLFHLNQAPLFRVVLFEVSQEETVLAFHFHHLICDGWSIRIFIKELEEAYQKGAQGQEANWKPLSCEYNTFVQWQKELALKTDYKTIENYWKQRLWSDEYPILSVSPFLASGNVDKTASKSVFLDSEALLKLKAFAAQRKVTLSVILMAAFHAVLHLYSGENKVYIGYPAANRPSADFQEVIGFFVNTLVCKTESSSCTTFSSLIEQVKKGVWHGVKETAYPFQHLLNLLKPPRFAQTSPLFQAMFVMQNAPVALKQFATLEVELLKIPSVSPLYDLVLEVRDQEEKLELIFEYQKEKIPSSFIEQIGECYLKFLNIAIENPSYPLEKYKLVDDKEHTSTLIQISEETNVITLFEQQASRTPEKIAIFSDHGNLTYTELRKIITSIAHQLLQHGVQPGDLIGVCLNKEPLLIASLLGILKAGAAYVPIDPAYSVDRMQVMLEDAQIRFLITRENLKGIFSFFKGKLIDPFAESSDIDLTWFPSLSSTLPAYVLYTSGSTGKPKGVVVEHKSLVNFAIAALQLFEMKMTDRPLQFSSISWDTSSEEIYPCLLAGGSLVLRGDGPVESFDDLLERTKNYQITIWNLPSSYWHDLVEMIDRKQIPIPPSLRLVIVGGEKVNHSKVNLWLQKIAPHVKLLNTYGATEATSISAVFDLSNWQPGWVDVPIGHAIQNVQLYVLNSFLEPVPPGMLGTLYIGGAGIARGYLNLPELTGEKFIFYPKTNERIYNTGDSAYCSLTGEILLKGRKDRQIKRRGFRVELEEIEKALIRLDQVDTCLVVFSDQLIKAYIVAKNRSEFISTQTVKTFLRQSLPDYLIPDSILFVSDIPRLPNGKIDLLSLQSVSSLRREETVDEKWTDTERKILTIWKSILRIESINKEESFFDVGGSSLLLIQLHERLQEAFSIRFNISLLFSHFTISSQAQKIAGMRTGQSKLTTIDLLRQLEQGLITPIQAHELLKAGKEVE